MRKLLKFLTSLGAALAMCITLNWILFSLLLPGIPGGTKALGTYPVGFLVLTASILSIYLSAKLGGYVWNRLS